MTLWTSQDAARATGGQTGAWQASGLSIDTRSLRPGDMFIALQAARDGHDFVASAFEEGASAAMVSRVPKGVDPTRCLLVDDVQKGLESLGRAARARSKARIVGITGSVGKTSAKELLRCALDGQGRIHAAEASYNNHWGVPLTLARMPEDTDFGIFEIGMSAPGEIAPLAKQVAPHVAMITTVAPAHLAAFDGLPAIAREKSAIFAGLVAGGDAIIPGDLDTSFIMSDAAAAADARITQFGTASGNDYQLLECQMFPGQTRAQALLGQTRSQLALASEGAHFATLALGVLAVVDALGADQGRALANLAGWSAPSGRGQRETITLGEGRFDLIDDAFNANPASMEAGLAVLAAAQPGAGGQRVAILGDMLELGPQALALHAALAESPAMQVIDTVHTVGPLMKALHDALPAPKRGHHAGRADDLASDLSGLIAVGDVVLIKGSKGSLVSRLVDIARDLGNPPHPDHAKD